MQKFLGKDAAENTGYQAQDCLQEFVKGETQLPLREDMIAVLNKVINQFNRKSM